MGMNNTPASEKIVTVETVIDNHIYIYRWVAPDGETAAVVADSFAMLAKGLSLSLHGPIIVGPATVERGETAPYIVAPVGPSGPAFPVLVTVE